LKKKKLKNFLNRQEKKIQFFLTVEMTFIKLNSFTLEDLSTLVDKETFKLKKFDDFTVFELKKLTSKDLQTLYKKKIG
jgi:hypothetical protein